MPTPPGSCAAISPCHSADVGGGQERRRAPARARQAARSSPRAGAVVGVRGDAGLVGADAVGHLVAEQGRLLAHLRAVVHRQTEGLHARCADEADRRNGDRHERLEQDVSALAVPRQPARITSTPSFR